MACGSPTARRRARQSVALLLAAGGGALLMGGSYELSPRNFAGDLLTLLGGLMYGGYLIFVERARTRLQALPLLILATLFAIPLLVAISFMMGETFWPTNWTPLLVLALTSQVIGQGLLVYSIGHFPPLVVGLALADPAGGGGAGRVAGLWRSGSALVTSSAQSPSPPL